jgi:hypothetical protein
VALEAKLADRSDVWPGTPVVLDGTDSTGASTYDWEIVEPQRGARLVGSHEGSVLFIAAESGEYRIRLTVSDGRTKHTTIAVVTVKGFTVRLEPPETPVVGQPVELSATSADAPAGVAFLWHFTDPSPDTDPFVRTHGSTATMLPWKPGMHSATVHMRSPRPPELGGGWMTMATDEVRFDVMPAPNLVGGGSEEAWWQDKLIADTRGALATTVAAANTWQGYTATLLALFGTVTIAAGPDALTDVPTPVRWIVLALTGIGFLAAITGIVLLSTVTAKAPRLGSALTGTQYRTAVLERVRVARRRYAQSKFATMTAGVLIAAGSLLAAGATVWPGPSTTYVLVRSPDQAFCGPMSTSADGQLIVAGRLVAETEAVTLVETCGELG